MSFLKLLKPRHQKLLDEAGVTTPETAVALGIEGLTAISGIGDVTAETILEVASNQLEKQALKGGAAKSEKEEDTAVFPEPEKEEAKEDTADLPKSDRPTPSKPEPKPAGRVDHGLDGNTDVMIRVNKVGRVNRVMVNGSFVFSGGAATTKLHTAEALANSLPVSGVIEFRHPYTGKWVKL